MKNVLSQVLIAIFVFSTITSAQKILTFDFSVLLLGNEVTAPSNYNNSHLNPSTMFHGPGVSALDQAWKDAQTASAAYDPGLFNSYNWTTNSSVDLSDYIEFTITPESGYMFSINSFIIQNEKQNNSVTNFILRTSDDGFIENIGGINNVPRANSPPVITTIACTLIDISNPLTIRLYAYGAQNYLKTWGVGIGAHGEGRTPVSDDHIIVNGFVNAVGSPSIFASKPSLSYFSYYTGLGPSDPKIFNLIGNNLTGDITVDGSTTNYEVSLDGSTFSPSVSIANGGSVPSTPIYVRLKTGLAVGDYNENLIIANGTTQIQVPCYGFVSPYNLVINEICADPIDDANGDIAISNTNDQFVELVNKGTTDINLLNFTVSDGGLIRSERLTARHRFTNTILPVDQAIVVFGGGSITNFTSSQAQLASTGRLAINDGGDKVTIKDDLGRTVAVYAYGPEAAEDQSLARNPDFIGPFKRHSLINGLAFSPGRNNETNDPLPVELSSFSAIKLKSGEVKLNWKTETEVNNYGFDVERKSKNDNWNSLGFIQGNGNSNSPKDYTFIDETVIAQKYLYRLKQIDNNGQFAYSKTIEVDLSVPGKFELSQNYPNPFNPVTTIRFTLPEAGNVKLSVFNLLGEEVAMIVNENMEAGVHTVSFDASNLNSGLYVYRIEANGTLQSKKMILLK